MANIQALAEQIQQRFGPSEIELQITNEELTLEIPSERLREICLALRDEAIFKFNMLIDVCGVDYQDYGLAEWRTEETTETGFSRGVNRGRLPTDFIWQKPRFAAIYHLLSLEHNHRLRIRAFAKGEPLIIDSVIAIWPAANWFEREAFDLYGILFNGHPDLRRILTDYGFVGHPFRKDFPLIGNVEMRYDAALGRCVYEPVSIQPRTLVPKVIREDNRYLAPAAQEGRANG